VLVPFGIHGREDEKMSGASHDLYVPLPQCAAVISPISVSGVPYFGFVCINSELFVNVTPQQSGEVDVELSCKQDSGP
jgi:hypothetical protein